MRSIILGLLVSLATVGATAQAAPTYTDTAPPPSARFPADWYLPEDRNAIADAPIAAAPYSATMVTTYIVPPSASSPQSRGERRDPWYRDSMGRTRKEESRSGSYRTPDGVFHYIPLIREIDVVDPVSHCHFHWIEDPGNVDPDTSANVAKVYCGSRVVQYAPNEPEAYIMKQEPHKDPGDSPFVSVWNEPLGKKDIEGFVAFGMRRVVSHPKDSPPTTKVLEVWYSPQLHELIWAGPASLLPGDSRYEMKEIHLGEPNPDLFYPPKNFRLVLERPYVLP